MQSNTVILLVCAIYFVVVIGTGIYASSRSKKASDFADTRETFTEEQLRKEAGRCLKCGVSVVDENKCVGCGLCTTKCTFDAISIEKRFDGKFVSVEEAQDYLEPYVLKVKGNEVYREPAKK